MYFFSYFIKLCKNWSNFQLSYETKKDFMEKITRLILEVIISDGHTPDGQTYSILQLSFNTEKIRLN